MQVQLSKYIKRYAPSVKEVQRVTDLPESGTFMLTFGHADCPFCRQMFKHAIEPLCRGKKFKGVTCAAVDSHDAGAMYNITEALRLTLKSVPTTAFCKRGRDDNIYCSLFVHGSVSREMLSAAAGAAGLGNKQYEE